MPIQIMPQFMPPGPTSAPLSVSPVTVDPSLMGGSAFSPRPGGTSMPFPTTDDSHQTPAGYDNSTPDTPNDVVKEWKLSPDGKSLVGVDGNGQPQVASIAQGQADAAAGRATVPPQLMNPPPGGGGPAGEALKLVTGAAMPQPPAQPGAGVDARAQRELSAGIDEQKRAIQQGAQAGASRAAEQAVYQDQLSQHLDTMNAQQAQKQGQQQRFMDGQLRDLQTQMAAVNSAKVDPGHWYASRDTGQKVLAGLGIALGALGQAFTGGPNVALQMVMGAIDRDIDAQKTNLANGREGVAQKMNLVSLYRQKFGDDAQADAAARATMLDAAKVKLQSMAAKYDSPEAKAKAAEMLAQLDQEKAKALGEFGQRTYERSVQAATLGLEQEKVDALRGRAGAKAGAAYEPALQAVEMVARGYKEKIATGLGSSVTGVTQYVAGTDAKEYEDLRRAAATQIGTALKGSPLRDSDINYYLDLLPTPGDGQVRAKAKLLNLRKLLSAKAGANLQPSGFAADPEGD